MTRRINIATHAGFCTGVSQAYKKVIEVAQTGGRVYILGLLVHNAEVIEKIKQLGAKTISSISEIDSPDGAILIISAHGIGPAIYDEAKKIGLKIVDTTCPWVFSAQKKAFALAEEGFQVIIVGDKDHTEVKGIKAWAGENSLIVENAQGLTELPISKKIGIIAQTTQTLDNLMSVSDKISKIDPGCEVRIQNTICDATSKRQGAALDLVATSDVMLVIGDSRSANTKRLTELCLRSGVETHQIQNSSELEQSWLTGKKNIGVTAGASTPDWVISEVVAKIPE